MSDPAERRIGTVIANKWRVDALLGSGSMAAVFAVTHRNGARAALKILHPTLSTDEGVCERFLGEGYLTNSVKHPGIVRVLDDGVTDDGCVFLVMDLLEGKTLEAFRQDRGGQIPVVEMLDIADKLMDVLHAVHEVGIIHRDLKPQNVFVCNDFSVKLLDFGVARVFDGSAQSKLSMFGLVLGTPSFMSPEQAVGSRDKVDHRADIWSLGATIFTGLTGQTVHLAPHVQAKLLAAATVKARSISMAKQDLPAPIAQVIDTSLRFKKEERFQSVDAYRRALRDARSEAGLGKPESVPPLGVSEPPPKLTTAPPRRVETAGAFQKGPSGTLVGSFGLASSTPDADEESAGTVPHIPAAPRAPDLEAPAGYAVRSPLESRPDGSYPAVGGTHGTLSAQLGTRSSGSATWIAGCLIAGAAVAGIAFFSMKGTPSADAQSVSASQAALTSATPPPAVSSVATPPAVTTTTIAPQIDPRDLHQDASLLTDGAGKASPLATPARTAPAAPPVMRPRAPQQQPHAPGQVGEDVRPNAAPEPPVPTTLPPDPFGTPE
jgi:serine/threonine protein kinase